MSALTLPELIGSVPRWVHAIVSTLSQANEMTWSLACLSITVDVSLSAVGNDGHAHAWHRSGRAMVPTHSLTALRR